VYSSPLQRCRDSAAKLTTWLGLPAPVVAMGINDINYGLWQGRLAAEVAAEEPERYALWQDSPQEFAFPQGESLAIIAARSNAEIAVLAARHREGCIAVYTHDSIIRTVLLGVLRAPFQAYHRIEIDPCSLSEIRFDGDAVELVRINERT
jgi:probable phosphoglycerate mutase